MKRGMKLFLFFTLGILISISLVVAVDVYADSVSYWQFEGDATDSEGSNDGTVNGANLTSGKVGQAYEFDGIDDYILLPNTIDNPINQDSHTIMGWVNLRNNNSVNILNRGLVSTGGIIYGMNIYASPTTMGYQRNQATASYITAKVEPIVINQNQWNHIAYTYNKTSGEVGFYLNGSYLGSDSVGTGDISYHASYDEGYSIGALRRGLSNNYNDAIVDEVAIWNKVLSASEILDVYNSGLTGNIDLIVQNVSYDNASFYVTFCNIGSGSDTKNVSVLLENYENSTFTSGNIYALPGAGACDTTSGIALAAVNFSEGDLLLAVVDSNDTVNEAEEENNDLDIVCVGGSCVVYLGPSCIETDSGIDYYINGSTNYTDSFGTTIDNDGCVGSVLTEYYCNGTVKEQVSYDCPWNGGCSNGACELRGPVVDYGETKGYAMDHETNLFWQRESVSGLKWSDSRNYCEAAEFGGFIDWRLPSFEELEEFYPASLGASVSSFLSGGHYVGSTSKIEVSAHVSGNNIITGVGARAKSGDVDRVRLEVKELQGCTMGPIAHKLFGSGNERYVEAPDGYVATAVGMGCVHDCNVKNMAIYVKRLNAPCSLGSDTQTIYHGSKGPERFYRAPAGYIITGVTARARPGNIRGITLGYGEIQLLPGEKYMDIEVGDNYWSSNESYDPEDLVPGVGTPKNFAHVLNWDVNGTSSSDVVIKTGSNNVVCVRDGRITPEQKVGVSSCQMCIKHVSGGSTAGGFFGKVFGFNKPYETNWECTGFDDTALLNNFACPVTGWFAAGACDVDSDDTLKLKVGCGDPSLSDTCQLCRRYADLNGRDNATVSCIGFNGLSLNTDFVGDVNDDDDFDLSANCSDSDIRDNCQLCRRNNGGDWDCVQMDGTFLETDFNADVGPGYGFDLKVRCDIEPAPSCLDEDDGADYETKSSCTDLEGDVNWDYCNGTTLTEFTCGANFTCESQEVDCPYGCLDGACIPREEKNDAYFVLNEKGEFVKTLNEIIGENHDLAGVDFRSTRFRLRVDTRMLSAVTSTSGYEAGAVSSIYDIDNYAQINSIQRHNFESYSDPDKVPETVFEENKYDIDVMENQSILDISSETDNEVYLHTFEQLDQYGSPGVIHSNRGEASGVISSAPSKNSFVDDGIVNTYGNVFSAYVDFYGNLTFKYETQNPNSRAVVMVGVLACECSPGEERCDGDDYLACNDGCGWINNGEVVGECGVRLTCSGGYDEFNEETTNGYENNSVVNRTDICVNTTHLQEYSCDVNTDDVLVSAVECQLGCASGACVDCVDSDGEDYSVLGDTQGRDLSGVLFANETDRCLADTLVERICTNGFLDSTFFNCPNGCFKGACVSVECSVEVGNTTVCDTMSYNETGSFCGTYDTSLNNMTECDLGCSGGVCTVSTCDDNDLGISENVTKSDANDSEGNTVTDVCANDEYLAEAVCFSGVAISENRYCSRGCQNGKCIGESNCNDTDGGLDYYEEGVVSSCVGQDCVTGENESCIDGNLWESYCGKNSQAVWQQVECPEGCNVSTNRTCNLPENVIVAACAPVVLGGPDITPGIRVSINGTPSYCDPETLTYVATKAVNVSCINDFECDSNACVEGACYEIRAELATQRDILVQQTTWIQEIRCLLRDVFGIQDEVDCLNETIIGG